MSPAVLAGLRIADEPAVWEALGFTVTDGVAVVGGVAIELAGRGAGEGILGWTLADVPHADVVAHPNGVDAVDHVVAVTGDLDAAMAGYAEAGLQPRRVREAGGGLRQVFYVLGTALLELAGPAEGEGEPRLWGVTFVARDLDALTERLGPLLGEPRDAVQPGRRIATLRREAGASAPLAFISPR
ncbi:MAG: VOC family protein [Solirubrobacteraceae bacterium]